MCAKLLILTNRGSMCEMEVFFFLCARVCIRRCCFAVDARLEFLLWQANLQSLPRLVKQQKTQGELNYRQSARITCCWVSCVLWMWCNLSETLSQKYAKYFTFSSRCNADDFMTNYILPSTTQRPRTIQPLNTTDPLWFWQTNEIWMTNISIHNFQNYK